MPDGSAWPIRRERPAKPVRIDMACNDPDNGWFAGRCSGVSLPGGVAEFEVTCGREPRLTELPGAIRIFRRVWPITRSRHWVGNWCWNRYWMEPPAAAAFVLAMHRSAKFSCTMETQLDGQWNFQWWEMPGDTVSHARMESVLLRAMQSSGSD